MYYVIIVWLILLTVYVIINNKLLTNSIASLNVIANSLGWMLKKKKILTTEELREGFKIAKGEKMPPVSLSDFLHPDDSDLHNKDK